MRRNRILAALVLALLLAAALCLPAGAFSKEPSSWAADQCRHLENAGILRSDDYSVKDKDPGEAISRWAFCQLLVDTVQNTGDWGTLAGVDPVDENYFTDINSYGGIPSASTAGVEFAMRFGAAYGITEGSSKNGQRIADAQSPLTREQAAKMMCALVDALEKYAGVPAPQEGAGKTYTDQASISSWAVDSVARASRLGILQGDSTGKFNPKGTLTWQEACVMVDRTYTPAEAAVTARNEERGIQAMDTALGLDADHLYLDSSTKTYLLQNGSVLAVTGYDKELRVESYNADGSSAGVKTIPLELDMCGGFCESGDAYYLAFGQGNMEESASKEVFRIVKYDKSWNRQGAASISNCYTTEPFDFTNHTALAENNGTLILHTSRQRYLTSDGLRHQSNFTAKVRTSDMTVTYQSDQFDDVNYTSHSFAQYIAFDNGRPVYVDHGDAYPRGFNLSVEDSSGYGKQTNFFSFYGATGDNTTNAIPGGLGVSGSHYLFAGASSPQDGDDSLKKANAFLAVIPKSGGQPQIKWLTSCPGISEYVGSVRLAQVNNNTFVVMWQTVQSKGGYNRFGDLTYAVFDGQGNQVGETKTCPGFVIPVTDPIVQDGHVRWARQELDRSGIYALQKNRYVNIYDLDIDANGATAETGSSTQTPAEEIDTKPNAKYPTMDCEVNGLNITRTDVANGATTAYYREDWDGNWLEVSVEGDTIRFTGCVKDNHSSAVLAVGSVNAQSFITPGEPFSLTGKLGSADLSNKLISVGTRGDGDKVYTTFRSGVTLKTASDGGKPALKVEAPAWIVGSAPSQPTVKELKYMPKTLEMTVGEVKDTFAFVYGASGTLKNESSDPTVAAFNGSDLKALKAGTTVITITVTMDNEISSGQCTVTVKEAAQQPETPSVPETPEVPETPSVPETPGQTGEVEYVNGIVCTKLPSDGVVTSYREEQLNGDWLQIDVVGGDTIQLTGMKADDFGGRYNYVVLRAFGVQEDTPFTAGVPFSVSAKVNAAGLAAFYESEGGPTVLSAMICQNYRPGDSNFAGTGFSAAYQIAVVPDGNGGVAFRITRR